MRGKADIEKLRQIASIRELQCVAAKGKAAGAAAVARSKSEAKAVQEHGRDVAAQGWLDSVSTAVHPELSQLWATHLIKEEHAVRRAGSDAQGAAKDLDRRARDWHAAVGRHKAANKMATRAVKERASKREETALQEASDRHLQRKVAE